MVKTILYIFMLPIKFVFWLLVFIVQLLIEIIKWLFGIDSKNKYIHYQMQEIDKLNGLQFEDYVEEMLHNIGYKNVLKTKASNDFGIDIIAEKDNKKYAIQCKKYSNPLGIKCVQEAYSGKQYYSCDVGVVLTNSTFSKQAVQLSQSTGILLWDRKELIDMVNEYSSKDKNKKEKDNIFKNNNNESHLNNLLASFDEIKKKVEVIETDEILEYLLEFEKMDMIIEELKQLNYSVMSDSQYQEYKNYKLICKIQLKVTKLCSSKNPEEGMKSFIGELETCRLRFSNYADLLDKEIETLKNNFDEIQEMNSFK